MKSSSEPEKKENKKMLKGKILVVGPSDRAAKGGISSVIRAMREDKSLRAAENLTFFSSFIDGPAPLRYAYSMWKMLCFAGIVPRYDLIHIHMAADGSAVRKALYVQIAHVWKKKVIIHLHGSRFLDYYQGLSEGRKAYMRRVFQSADRVLALSEGWKHALEEQMQLHNCSVLPNGISVEELEVCRVKRKLEPIRFLFLGRLGKRKGTYDLMKVLIRMKREGVPLLCTMAGDGAVEEFRKWASEENMSDCIEIVGWVDREKMKNLMEKAQVLVLPSYNEGLPMAILEAMAAGMAVVSTTAGAIPEVIENGKDGFIFEAGDLEAMEQALRCCQSDPYLCRRMGEAAHQKVVSQYSWKAVREKLIQYYEEIWKTG